MVIGQCSPRRFFGAPEDDMGEGGDRIQSEETPGPTPPVYHSAHSPSDCDRPQAATAPAHGVVANRPEELTQDSLVPDACLPSTPTVKEALSFSPLAVPSKGARRLAPPAPPTGPGPPQPAFARLGSHLGTPTTRKRRSLNDFRAEAGPNRNGFRRSDLGRRALPLRAERVQSGGDRARRPARPQDVAARYERPQHR
ncbi:uncharacterized protein LOC144164699 [Haemaphysalis longicornis]